MFFFSYSNLMCYLESKGIVNWIKFSWNSWSTWKELGWLKWLQFLFCKGLSSFNLKGFSCSYTCSSSLCESTTSCCTRLITIRLWEFLFKFLSGFTSFVSSFFFLYRLPCLYLCTVFHANSSDIDDVLLINPSSNKFVFEDFNIHHKDWLAYSDEIHKPGLSKWH